MSKFRPSSPFVRTLPLGLAAVFSVSFFAFGNLGGAQGIDVPFSGFLQAGAAAMNDSDVDFTFTIFDSSTNNVSCDEYTATGVDVVDGRFATVIEDVAEACVKRKDPHVEIAVDGVALTGRQRLFPAVGAYTSGTGDFDSIGLVDSATLNVRGAGTVNSLSVTTTASVGGALTASSGASITGAVGVTGAVTASGAVTGASGRIGDVNTNAAFSHKDQATNTNYALMQNNIGETVLNAATSRSIRMRINNSDKIVMDGNGNLTISGGRLYQQVCASGFSAVVDGRLCISTSAYGPSRMHGSGTGSNGYDANDGAIANCRLSGPGARVCTSTDIAQACAAGFDPFVGIQGNGNTAAGHLWYGELIDDNSFNYTAITDCADTDLSAGRADGISGSAKYRCCY